ncbi:MAG: HAD family hydrolase [Chloroflexi bacterium]|nr:HAD family hydrolase [Chloroflexota bacterium]
MLRVRWLFFDLGDTIWRSSTPESRRAAGLYPKVGQRMADWLRARGHQRLPEGAALAEPVWEEVDAAARRCEGDTMSEADLGAAAQCALARLGLTITVDDGRALWELAQAPAPERGAILLEDAPETLGALKQKGVRLGIITNRTFGEAFTRRDLSALGLDGLFEHVIVSSDVGYLKPHPRIFQAALSAAGARPQECALVGDNMRADVQGAQDAGLRAIWLRSPRTASDRPVTPDATIDRLLELLDLVEPIRS